MRKPSCHPKLAHHAKGLCNACYQKIHRGERRPDPRGSRAEYQRIRRQLIKAKGLCAQCGRKPLEGNSYYCAGCVAEKWARRRARRALTGSAFLHSEAVESVTLKESA